MFFGAVIKYRSKQYCISFSGTQTYLDVETTKLKFSNGLTCLEQELSVLNRKECVSFSPEACIRAEGGCLKISMKSGVSAASDAYIGSETKTAPPPELPEAFAAPSGPQCNFAECILLVHKCLNFYC